MFKKYQDFKEREMQRLEYEKWLAQERQNKTSRSMAGNLALTFLFKDQDLHEIIKFKQGNGTNGAAAAGQDGSTGNDKT